jgi:hypothetical protein
VAELQQSPVRPGNVTAVSMELRFDKWFLPLSVPLGLGPQKSELRVEGDALYVKMGWGFTASIPLASIVRAERSDARVLAAGVHFARGRWLVNGSREGLVALTIEPAARAKVWFRSASVGKLELSVTEPDAFIAAVTGGA